MIGQVQVVCILMIIQGVMECLVGLLVGVAALFFPEMVRSINFLVKEEQRRQPIGQPAQEIPAEFGWFVTAIALAMASAVLVAGLLKLTAAIRGLEYRGRAHGIVALSCSILAFPICYCAPTGLVVMIYGLIVYLNGDVGRAFAMVKGGKTAAEVREYFSGQRRPARLDHERPRPQRRIEPDEPGPTGEPDERIR